LTHQVNDYAAAPPTVFGADVTTGQFNLAAGTYSLKVKTQKGWRGGSATLMLNNAAVLGPFVNDWAGSVVLAGGAYSWQLAGAGGNQNFMGGFVGIFDQ